MKSFSINSVIDAFWSLFGSVTGKNGSVTGVTDFDLTGTFMNMSPQKFGPPPIASAHCVASIFTIFMTSETSYGPPIIFPVSVAGCHASMTAGPGRAGRAGRTLKPGRYSN